MLAHISVITLIKMSCSHRHGGYLADITATIIAGLQSTIDDRGRAMFFYGNKEEPIDNNAWPTSGNFPAARSEN